MAQLQGRGGAVSSRASASEVRGTDGHDLSNEGSPCL